MSYTDQNTFSVPTLDYSNLQGIVIPYDGGPAFREFLDPSFIGILRFLIIDHIHRVRPDEVYDLQLISFRKYGVVSLWWVIGLCNAIVNPFLEVTPARELEIPTISSIQDYFKQANTRQSTGIVQLP